MSQPIWWLLGEARAPGEWLAGFGPMTPLPRGDGHPVMVLPGLGTGDAATLPLRRRLEGLGYDVHGWGQGINRGMKPTVGQAMARTLDALHARGGPVSLVGWSLGGIFARELSRRTPEKVRQIITLGSPFGGSGAGSNIERVFKVVAGRGFSGADERRLRRLRSEPPVPSTAIYSRTDGLVNWRHCLERRGALTDNVRLLGSHGGLCGHPLVHYVIADRLAQPAERWRPFDRTGWRALMFGGPDWPPLR